MESAAWHEARWRQVDAFKRIERAGQRNGIVTFSLVRHAALTPPGRRHQAPGDASGSRTGPRGPSTSGMGTALQVCLLVQLYLAAAVLGAAPIFENRTPVGFSIPDSVVKEDFVEGQEISVRVDLNQAATPTYPVIGHFHNVERSDILETTDIDGLRADVAVSSDGVIHTAWISQKLVSPVTTPVYFVNYSRSANEGQTFTTPVSVSGDLRFDVLTTGTSFSTVDLEVDSRGNPRIAYAFDFSPDGKTVQFNSSNPNNVYFNYSQDAGATWLPGNDAVIVNDVATVGASRDAAFPRVAIDQRDNIFITYVRGSTLGTGTDDIMLARVNRATSPFSMVAIGSTANSGSSGGVRVIPDAGRHTGPDIDIGTGDVQGLDGAPVDGFVNDAPTNAALETDAVFYFPTVVVDQQSSPDEVYALYKFGDATFETIFFN